MADDETEGPVVSGISPKEGFPGTKVTIRGENLGNNKDDVIALTICGVNCMDSLEYNSSKKLVCQSPKYVGVGTIVVSTFSGGPGTCNVHFTGLEQPKEPLLDPLTESDVWMEEDLDSLTRGFSTKTDSPVYTRKITDPLGVSQHTKTKRKPSPGELEALVPNGSSDMLAQNFSPIWYLLEKHRFTSFFDLKLGARRLKNEVERCEQAPVQFMRDNLNAFIQCYDTLSDVNELLIRNESESQGGSLTDSVEELLKDSARRAESVFEGVIKCKVRADTTRNALLVLQRYRFLFSLPRSIEKNIKSGEYDLVTTDYEKAKSLFDGTQVSVFKKVLEKVETQISNFRGELYRMLQKLPSTLEEQKKIIKYLLELDCEGDPAWDCITAMHHWLIRLLFSSKEEHQAPASRLSTEDLSSKNADVETPPALPPRSRSTASSVGPSDGHHRTMSDVSYASSISSQASHTTASTQLTKKSLDGEFKPTKEMENERYLEWQGRRVGARLKADIGGRPMRILFVEELTEMIQENLPDIWKLGQAYLSKTLFQGVSILDESRRQQTLNCDYHQPKFDAMIVEVIQVYTDMVNCSLFYDAYKDLTQKRKDKLGEWVAFDDPLMESSGDWLPLIVRQIKECVDSLQVLTLPESAVDMIRQLTFNVRTLCADTLFNRTARDIEVLHVREDWRIHAEEGGIITSLPVLFENMVVEVLLTLKEIVIEVDSETIDTINKELLYNTVQHFHGLLEHFASCFDYLAFHQEEDLQQEMLSVESEQGVVAVREEPEGAAPNSDERLLMIMSNMSYVMTEVIPRLFDCFVRHGYPQCPDVHDAILEHLRELDDTIFNEYIKRKSESIMGIIEQGIHVGCFDWETCGEPEFVRNYVKDVLLNLVLIHAEVYAVSSQIVSRVLERLVELLSDEFYNKIHEVEVFGYNGIIYAYVELTTLEDVLKPYVNRQSERNFEMSREYLADWDVQSPDNVDRIVEAFKEKTKLQLRCFHFQDNPEPSDSYH